MNGFDLVRAGTSEPIAAACGKCGLVHSPNIYVAAPEAAMAAARKAADECCAPRKCRDCEGETAYPEQRLCTDCRRKRNDAREERRFAAATVIEWNEDAGEYLFDPRNDRYYADEDEIEEDDPPPYAYATRGEALCIDAEDVLEVALDDHYEDARESISREEVAELQSFLDGWCQRTGVVMWIPDFSRVVVFSRKEGQADG